MFFRRTETAPGRRARTPLSITTRLFLIYAASAYAMLAMTAAVLYWVLVQGIERDDLHFVVDKVHRVEWALLRQPPDRTLLEHEVKWNGGVKHLAFYARVLDEQGRLVIETPAMAAVAPRSQFPPAVDVASVAALKAVEHWKSPVGGTYVVLSARVPDPHSGRAWLIQVAMDDVEEEALLANLRTATFAVLLLGILLSAALGGFAARRGMKPLQEIAVAAERITAYQLDERIDPARWPAELGALSLALNRMLGRLEDAFRRLGRCTADLAHELRTPIQNLMGEAGVALAVERRPDEYRRVLESSLEEYTRLSRMINEMLFLARAENPRQQIGRERFDARQELEAVKEFFEALSEARGVTVTCEGEAEVVADPVLFRRAVTNLLSNALRHTPNGGQIVLSLARDRDGALVVKVEDSGCGIHPEHLPRLCERRYTTDPGDAHGTRPSGLGLSIVKSIVELHGGSIAIESALDRGTSVLLRFPPAARSAA